MTCPRCGAALRAPGLMDSSWQCERHGGVSPLRVLPRASGGHLRQVAAHAASAAGGAIVGLVLVGPTTDPRAGGWAALVRRWLRTAVHEDPRQVPGLARQYARTGLGSMRRGMDAARRDDLRATLDDLRLPVLAVRGPQDRICPQDWAERLAPWCLTLTGGGHLVPCTHGPELGGVLTRFAADVAPR